MKAQDMRGLKRWVIVISVCAATPFVFLNLPVKMQPVINDISTDLDNPPVWTTISKGPLPESSKEAIRSYYKDLKPLILPQQQSTTYKHGENTLSRTVWTSLRMRTFCQHSGTHKLPSIEMPAKRCRTSA